jgi:hypothetical protein
MMIASIWHLTPDAWTAIATWLGACVAVAVGIGAVTVGGRQLSEARRLRREQAQPYVVVFTEGSGNDPRHFDLVIKNFGMTAATDVRVVFSAPLESAVLRGPPNHSPIRTPDVIPVLVPGQEWRTFWDFTAARAGASDLPDEYTATVTFSDSGGRASERRISVRDRLARPDRPNIGNRLQPPQCRRGSTRNQRRLA